MDYQLERENMSERNPITTRLVRSHSDATQYSWTGLQLKRFCWPRKFGCALMNMSILLRRVEPVDFRISI